MTDAKDNLLGCAHAPEEATCYRYEADVVHQESADAEAYLSLVHSTDKVDDMHA
jgi:hypothetical protein